MAYNEIVKLKKQLNESIIGQSDLVEKMLIVLLADGNFLLEGLPGLAKTRAIKCLSKLLKSDFNRIQFTPDLLPSDITGTTIYQPESDEKFIFEPGPIFSNLILADEINRAPAKVQAALLEAMEERQVSVAGKTYAMKPLFMVMATQNPIEQEGTYPLPEAQMDRFLMKVKIGYPDKEAEMQILDLVRGEKSSTTAGQSVQINEQSVFEARREIAKVALTDAMKSYITDLVFATRYPENVDGELAQWIECGVSPRGTIALDVCARAHAWMHQSDHVSPENIRAIAKDALRHRIILSFKAEAQGITTDDAIDKVIENVALA
ncbi:AAA family ATPase [Mangrovibacterium lignilyticum]|uniref:AAA family ATPase n=1 Tax=Mangrovibacterium lignilyticum TaxID=2668052 RepID=UPI0013D00F7C|nr:MoxR family ATPase [Mangrovibacterium lignilyticum]